MTSLRQRIKNSPIYHLECLRRMLRLLAIDAMLPRPTPPDPHRRGIRIGLLKRGGIGDWVLFSPVLEALCNGLPEHDVEIVVYTEARTAEIAEKIGLADRVVVFDRSAVRSRPRARHALLSAVRHEAFDLWIDADISRTNLGDAFALASAAPVRIGYAASALDLCHARIERRAYTHLVPDETGKVHMSVRFGRLIELAVGLLIELLIGRRNEAARKHTNEIGSGDRPRRQSGLRRHAWQGHASKILAITPATSSSIRNWPAERFVALAATLARSHDLRPVIVGDTGDAALCERIAEQLSGFGAKCHTGRRTLDDLFETIRNARLLLTCDSAPMHIGYLTGTPTLAMVSGADFTSYAGYPPARHFAVASHPDRSCFDCRWYCIHPVTDPDANRKCLAEVEVEPAVALAEALLQIQP